jgi:glycosyltransferase involved in cell wall biosynthesis
MKVTLCLLTKNEIAGCQKDVPLIKREMFDEIYAIDGGSTDGTIEYLQSANIPVYIQPKKGINAACVYAIEVCKTDALIFFHPKGSVPVSDTEKFKHFFESGYDLVIASRNIKGGTNEEDGMLLKHRKWFVLFLALVSAVLFRKDGPFIRDILHGFRGVTVKGFKIIDPVDFGVSIDLEMVSRAYKNRLKMIEFPTTEVKRLAGTSNFKALPTGWKLLKYFPREIFRKD